MKLLVLSDSHGNVDNMIQAVARTVPDMILHLGDGEHDARQMHEQFPAIPMEQVAGNCDWCSVLPPQKLICAADKRILMCHGHTLHVKESLLTALYAAQEQHADIFLFGHTHRIFSETRNGVAMLNPGSIGDAHYPTFGVVEITGGQILLSTVPLNGYPHHG